MTLFEEAAAGMPVRVRILSDPLAGCVGTLTLFDTAPSGKQLFVVTCDSGTPDKAFLYPDSYKLERFG